MRVLAAVGIGLATASLCAWLYVSGLETYHRYEGPHGQRSDRLEYLGESLEGHIRRGGERWVHVGKHRSFEHHPETRGLAIIALATAGLLLSVRVATRRARA